MRTKMIGRRGFVKSAAGLTAASLMDPAAFEANAQQGQAESGASQASGAARGLPSRGEFIVRHGCVLTMDPDLGDIPDGDVHVKNGAIIAVGKSLKAPGVRVLDARRMIVLPGMVDTHWHMWTTYLRCMAGDKTADGYFPVTTRLRPSHETRGYASLDAVAAAEPIDSGTTTVNDECHNIRSFDYAVADPRALRRRAFAGASLTGPTGEYRRERREIWQVLKNCTANGASTLPKVCLRSRLHVGGVPTVQGSEWWSARSRKYRGRAQGD